MSRWPMVALGKVLTQYREYIDAPEAREYPKLSVKLYGKGAVLDAPVDGASLKMKRHQLAKPGQVILSEIWGKKGAIGFVPPSGDGALCTSHFFLFDVDTSKLEPGWLQAIFTANYLEPQLEERAFGTTGYASVRPRDLVALEIPLPPMEEQRRVVEKLDRLATQSARLRNLQGHVEGAVDALLLARLNRFFGDPYQGIVGDGGFTEFASVQELSSDVADGPHATPQYVDEGVPFVTVLNITSGRVDFNGAKHITPAAHEMYSKRAKAESGDVLISKDGTLGVPCHVDTDREFSFFVSVALVKPRRDLLYGRFLTWALRAPYLQDRIAERSRGDMIRHLVLREIRQLLVPVASLADQRRIVSELDAVERRHQSLAATMRQSQGIATAISGSVSASAFAGSGSLGHGFV